MDGLMQQVFWRYNMKSITSAMLVVQLIAAHVPSVSAQEGESNNSSYWTRIRDADGSKRNVIGMPRNLRTIDSDPFYWTRFRDPDGSRRNVIGMPLGRGSSAR